MAAPVPKPQSKYTYADDLMIVTTFNDVSELTAARSFTDHADLVL